jgi:hypothetical protein
VKFAHERERRLFFVFLVLEFGRIPESQNLPSRMASQDAMGPFGLEGDDGDVPRTGSVGGRHAAARKTLERFKLENRARRSYGANR